MDIIRIDTMRAGKRVILALDSGGCFMIATQEHRAICSPYCPDWEFGKDGWRSSIIEYARSQEDADRKYQEHLDREKFPG